MTSTTQDESNNPATESEISKNIRPEKKQEQRNVAQDGPIIPKFAKIFFEKAGDRNLHPHSSGTHVQFPPRLPAHSD
ncbi:hypothetical protein N7455_011534 [Penicillium solitum]|uniref:uncharacterized protein n=1 Tax=Penicillium solitum TaxID=60172 RepID=UPI0032C4806B|nr:hypothetical protein N7455_011534 [Penicillium solitum]